MAENTSSRKCPTCGQWSKWSQNPDDYCEHCGAVLDPEAIQNQQKREDEALEQKKRFNLDLIEIHPYETGFTRFWKQIVRAFQISLIAIISFIIWLVTLVAA